jgi:hypothetical protein
VIDVEPLVRRELDRLLPLPVGVEPDWTDVCRRAGHTRRPVLLLAGLVAALAIAAPALGLHRTVIQWFEADPAPERVQLDFKSLDIGAPAGMESGVLPNSARRVTEVRLSDGMHTLWVAPTASGGFCLLWSDYIGGCTRERTPPPQPLGLSPDLNSFLIGATFEQDRTKGVTTRIAGRLLAPDAERLVIEYEDGMTAEIPFVWVSPPIDAGFFLFEIPAAHRRVGHLAKAVTVTDSDGDLLAWATVPTTQATGPTIHVPTP